ncbi:MAG: ATP-binding protein [Eubacteriales bacterium]|nr:ATP-binding protein [Eubacteriales bacterium]
MKRTQSLYTKLVLILLLLILSLMAVVGAFLMRGIRNFYLESFFSEMQSAFNDTGLVNDLRAAADEDNAPDVMVEILRSHAGLLGINSETRNYYILTSDTGEFLAGSDAVAGSHLEMTPNILTAVAGKEGSQADPSGSYMDVALPIRGEQDSYIVYIKDNRQTVQNLSSELFGIILEALAVGLVISAFLALLLAKTMVTPLQSLTHAAERVAAGDFSDKLETQSRDEIGVLTRTFNHMADKLEATLDDLKRSEQMRREFVANVSHELRTPITSIRSYAETLESSGNAIPPETKTRFLRVIVNESDRMTKIVQDLLTLSRFDAGSYEFSFGSYSFEKSVRDVYNATIMEAQRRHHEFSLEYKSPIPAHVCGDRARIEQVLINMVSNAIKYTPDGGRISLTAGADGDMVWASVRDNGIGIPSEDAGRVFERFYRVDKARSRESGGTGLGLSIAQEIVSRHDGQIELKSRPGRGTVITVRLPVAGPEAAHE